MHPARQASELTSWLKEEMNYSPSSPHCCPTEEQLQSLYRGQTQNLWKFVVSRVRHKEKIKNMRANIHFYNNLSNVSETDYVPAEQVKFIEMRKRCAADMAALKLANSQAEERLAAMEKRISDLETKCQNAASDLDSVRTNMTMLETYNSMWTTEVGKIKKLCNQFRGLSNKSEPPSEQFDASEIINDCCEYIVKDLTLNLFEEPTDPDWTATGSEIRSSIRDLNHYRTEHIVETITQTAKNSVLQLQQTIDEIDVTNDMQLLKMRDKNLEKTVDTHLQQQYVDHMRRAVKTKMIISESQASQKELEKYKVTIMAAIIRSSKSNMNCVPVAQKLAETKIENAGLIKMLQIAEEVAASLQNATADVDKQSTDLQWMIKRIDDFSARAQSKRNIINSLLKENSAGPEKLKRKSLAFHDYLKLSTLPRVSQVLENVTRLMGSIDSEVKQFKSLCAALPNQYFLKGEDEHLLLSNVTFSTAFHDNCKQDPRLNALSVVMDSLKFPLYRSVDVIFCFCQQLKEASEEEKALARHHQMQLDKITSMPFTKEAVSALVKKTVANDAASMENILPVVHEQICQMSQATSDCLKLKTTINDWKDQPAQFLVPWVTVDGKNLQQWKNLWLLHKVKQIKDI